MSESAHHSRVSEIFRQIRLLSRDAREQRLRALCGGEQALVDEIEDLLRHHDEEDGPLPDSVGALIDAMEREAGAGSPLHHHAPGDTFESYRLIEPIGEGAMGVVWLAEEVELGRPVALKFIRGRLVDERHVELFAREVRAGGRAAHPGIVTYFRRGVTHGAHWVAMEYVPGARTLQDELESTREAGELPADHYKKLARMFVEIADAMEVVHGAGVVHRDLKPQNILLTPDGHPKITDFGLARIQDETVLSMPLGHAGTLSYMSPEQAMAKSIGVDHRSDIFSLGVVLYEFLSHQRAFQGDSTIQVLEKIVHVNPPDPRTLRSQVPRDLAVICGKAMEKQRGHRYGTMAELSADLLRFLDHRPIHARPPGPVRKLELWVRRNPTWSAAGAVSVFAIGVITVLLLERAITVRARDEAQALAVELGEKVEANMRAARSAAFVESRFAYERLLDRVDELWPLSSRIERELRVWIGSMQSLVDDVPMQREYLDQLGALALPRTEEERKADELGHPEYEKYRQLRAALDVARGARECRTRGARVPLPAVDFGLYPEDPTLLNNEAWEMVRPDRLERGSEPIACVLAERALELAREAGLGELVPAVGDTLSRALFAVGRDEAALAASREALEAAPADRAAEFEGYVSELRGWIEDARSPEGLERAAREIADLEEQFERLREQVEARRTWRFPEDLDSKRLAAQARGLRELIDALEFHATDEAGLLSRDPRAVSSEWGWSVPRRLAMVEAMGKGMQAGHEWSRRWAEANEAIAAHPNYGGWRIEPIAGVVPIGADPASGLREFWFVPSGAEPERGADGRLLANDSMGIVLVLVPGGSYCIGGQSRSAAEPNYDPQAQPNAPLTEIELDPFLISKFEMTIEQWRTLTGQVPGLWPRIVPSMPRSAPVEQVTWEECVEVTRRFGLTLPTEFRWEAACRAGSDSLWHCGNDVAELVHVANLADLSYGRVKQDGKAEAFDDGFYWPAPVGSFAANAFGLHDMHGNVWEWCGDEFLPYDYPHHAGDGLRSGEGVPGAVFRGGSIANVASETKSWFRNRFPKQYRANDLGLRPALSVERSRSSGQLEKDSESR